MPSARKRIEDERLGHLRSHQQRLQEERRQLDEERSSRDADRLRERLEELAKDEQIDEARVGRRHLRA